MTQKIIINPKFSNLKYEKWIDSLPFRFEESGDLIYNGRNQVRKFNIEGKKIIVKRFKKPMWFQRIVYTWIRPSKAQRAFHNALELMKLGVCTPTPIAYIEIKKNGIFHWGYIIYEEIRLPQCSSIENEMTTKMIKALSVQLAEIHCKGILNGDLNLSNILFLEKEDKYTFFFIDINRCKFFKKELNQKKVCKDLWRVSQNEKLMSQILFYYSLYRNFNAYTLKKQCEGLAKRNRVKKKILHKLFPH